MIEYTNEELIAHRAQLVDALRTKNYDQARNRLRAGDSFCCLGVACDVSKLGRWTFDTYNGHAYVVDDDVSTATMPQAVMDYYGFFDENGSYGAGMGDSLTQRNDDGQPFEEIAAIIARDPIGLLDLA